MASPSQTSCKSGAAQSLSILPLLRSNFSGKRLDLTPHLWYNRHMKDLELMGDALEEYTQAQVFEAMADASEITEEEIEAWGDLWLQKENA